MPVAFAVLAPTASLDLLFRSTLLPSPQLTRLYLQTPLAWKCSASFLVIGNKIWVPASSK